MLLPKYIGAERGIDAQRAQPYPKGIFVDDLLRGILRSPTGAAFVPAGGLYISPKGYRSRCWMAFAQTSG